MQRIIYVYIQQGVLYTCAGMESIHTIVSKYCIYKICKVPYIYERYMKATRALIGWHTRMHE